MNEWFVYFRCKSVYETRIHPSNVNAVNDTRQQIRQLYSDRFVETNSSHVQNENNVNLVNSRHYGMDSNCPVCLNEPRFPIETNCGHLFCGKYSSINSLKVLYINNSNHFSDYSLLYFQYSKTFLNSKTLIRCKLFTSVSLISNIYFHIENYLNYCI